MLDKMPGVLRDALGQVMNYVVIALRVVLDRQVCGLDAQVTVAEWERRVAVATGSQVSGKQHPAWGGVPCGQTAGPWEGGLEVKCTGVSVQKQKRSLQTLGTGSWKRTWREKQSLSLKH